MGGSLINCRNFKMSFVEIYPGRPRKYFVSVNYRSDALVKRLGGGGRSMDVTHLNFQTLSSIYHFGSFSCRCHDLFTVVPKI